MTYIPEGRIEWTFWQSRFVFSDLEKLDPEGRYKVVINEWRSGGVPLSVRVSGTVKSIRFNLPSEGLDIHTWVFRAKINLLKKREEGDFDHLVDLLYDGPKRNISTPSASALEALTSYSTTLGGKVLRLPAKRFGLECGLTILGDFVAFDDK